MEGGLIMAKVGGPSRDMEGGLSSLAPVGKELAGRLNMGESLLGGLGQKGTAGGLKLPFSFK